MSAEGVADDRDLPDRAFAADWDAIIVDEDVRERLIAQGLLSLTMRRKLPFARAPLHGLILLSGPPGTGKTTIARGLANEVARRLKRTKTRFIQVEPHALGSAALGKSQQLVDKLFRQTILEAGLSGPAIVLLDEVETLAADRYSMSLQANPADVYRAVDAALSGLDQLALSQARVLILATTNFPQAVDAAFRSRADLIETIGLPNELARRAIVEDSLDALATVSPKVKDLKAHLAAFAKEGNGLDGRRLRKAILAAAASRIDVAQDPNLLTKDDVLCALRRAVGATEETP